jgi:hypothetical protein
MIHEKITDRLTCIKIKCKSQVWWCMPVTTALWEVETGE